MTKIREHIVASGKAIFYASIYPDLQTAALDCGWALGLHGSLSSDMDIMAMPWIEEAGSAVDMIQALRDCFDKPYEVGVSIHDDKPNNRRVFTLSIWADFYLDISIIKSP